MKLLYPFMQVKVLIIPTFNYSINISCNENDNDAFMSCEYDV